MEQPLRILVVLPLYGGSLPIGRYCAAALGDLGHVVDVFEAPAFYEAHTALRKLRVNENRVEQLEASFLNLLGQAVYARVEHFQPDLVLALAQAPMSRQLLQRLRKDGIPSAMWFVEDYRIFSYWRVFAPLYDFFFVIQKEPFLSLLKDAGVANAMYLPMAALPEFHKKLELTPAQRHEYGSDLSFLGAGYPNRRVAFRALLHRDFKIWGSDWEGDALLASRVQRGGARISAEESVLIYNAAKININLHSSLKADSIVSDGDFVNPRTFELAAMEAFQLVDRRSLMPELFCLEGDKAELAVFSSPEEMEQAIDFYLAHPQEREAVAKRGRERVLKEHTYQHRMRAMLDFIRARRTDWPTPRTTYEWPKELSAEMRKDIAALLIRLGLPEQASFDDVIARLRSQSGELDSLEAGLLFLDEWRKQYS